MKKNNLELIWNLIKMIYYCFMLILLIPFNVKYKKKCDENFHNLYFVIHKQLMNFY